MTTRIIYIAALLLITMSCNKHKNEELIFTENFMVAGDWVIEYGDTTCLADVDTNLLRLQTYANGSYTTDYVKARLDLAESTADKVCYRIHIDTFSFSGYEVDNPNSITAFNGGGTNKIVVQVGDYSVSSIHEVEDEGFSIINDFIDIEINVKRGKFKVYQGDKRDNITSRFSSYKSGTTADYIEFGCSSFSIAALPVNGPQSLSIKLIEIFNL